jgi:internalin A
MDKLRLGALLACLSIPLGASGCQSCKAKENPPPPPPVEAEAPSASASSDAMSGGTTASEASEASAVVAPPYKKRTLADCKRGKVDFGDDSTLEAEVRRQVTKTDLAPSDLAQIKTINLSMAPFVRQLDPCVFPMMTALKELSVGPGDYDDLAPLQKLTSLESLRIAQSQVKNLRPIAGLTKLGRLDVSHTLVTDDDLKPLASLANLTDLALDEDAVSDLTVVAKLKKLERLSIKKTQVKSVAPLAGMKTLKFLYIAGSDITDFDPLKELMGGGLMLVAN